jgi:CubicO group peptidase (beta-lactamase class C family)
MGGIAGHSGVFTTARDLQRYALELLRCYRGESDFIGDDTVRRYFTGPLENAEVGFRYGWDSPSKENGLADSGLSEEAVGHNSFTGCSLWIEPNRNISIILLSNRIHPSRSNRKIRTFRKEFHAAVLEALEQL